MLCKVWWAWVGWLKRNKLVLESMKKKVSVKFFLKTIMLVSSNSYRRHPCLLLSKLSGHFSLLTFCGCDPHFLCCYMRSILWKSIGATIQIISKYHILRNIQMKLYYLWLALSWVPFSTYIDRYMRRKLNLIYQL